MGKITIVSVIHENVKFPPVWSLSRLMAILLVVSWSRNVHRRQQPERIEMFIFSGLSLSRPVDTKTEFNLNNIIATLSLISISSVKKIRRQMSSSLVPTQLDEC